MKRMDGAFLLFFGLFAALSPVQTWAQSEENIRMAVFDIDVTPPIGSQMAYDPVIGHWDLGLRARGIVLLGAERPIVLCAVDWIGIANDAHDAFRKALADAAGTEPGRVAVHTLHQHDAPACDFTTENILREHGFEPGRNDGTFARETLERLAAAVRDAIPRAQPITHFGLGEARVKEVASNRRILGPDGKVRATRFTTCKDPDLRAEPEGTIDPVLSLVSFWNGEKPVAALSYYATHPQSYYRTGLPNPDFPGVARFMRQLAEPAALHIHFNGAGGNIGAGKYNDGSMENRGILAERLAAGMRSAWENTIKEPISAGIIRWQVISVALPIAKHLKADALETSLKEATDSGEIEHLASKLAWLRRCEAGHAIEVSCLSIGRARILHMPGELFVEYQLAAKAKNPGLFVAMAAYGDYGTGYIGTSVAYEQGGYETSERASNVAPQAETMLMDAISELLEQ